jgi:exonuclease SbcC
MVFEQVTAGAFGPFVDRTLILAPCMTLIYGANESGKSSWHAALYAGLCGRRRMRGAGSAEDREFAARHRPWSGGIWKVKAIIRLRDGRRVECTHDLEGNIDCSAKDIELGRDYSNEIMDEGSPDASKWLGLDRRAFLATACISQADVLGVLKHSELLQQHIQRAAATRGTDATAASALQRLADFKSEHVGLDRANSTKPLRHAMGWVQRADATHARARADHDAYFVVLEDADSLEAAAIPLRRAVSVLAASRARAEADVIRARLDEARALATRYPVPPTSPVKDDAMGLEVAEALRSWGERQALIELSGSSASELQERIEALPPLPEGDLEPTVTVLTARDALRAVDQRLAQHVETRPELGSSHSYGASAQELLSLADDLSIQIPPHSGVTAPTPADSRSRSHNALFPIIVGGLLVGAGVVLVVLGREPSGLAIVAIGGALLCWGMVRILGVRHSADVIITDHQTSHVDAGMLGRRTLARERVAVLGVSADPVELRRLAVDGAKHEDAVQRQQAWQERHDGLRKEREEKQERLAQVLASRSEPHGGDCYLAVDEYEAACKARRAMSEQSARRGDLERELIVRKQAEVAAAQVLAQQARAESTLRAAGQRCEMDIEDLGALELRLKAWKDERTAALAARAEAYQGWARLQALLDGATLEELEAQSRHRQGEADILGAEFSEITADGTQEDSVRTLEARRQELQCAEAAANLAKGRAEQRAATLQSVVEAEEDLEASRTELNRITRLAGILEKTEEFLKKAQDKVHRDMAPRLAAAVKHALPKVTNGRYTDVRVFPDTLRVDVLDPTGEWRDATHLSHGTAEQVYLLLRVALSDQLTQPNEVTPLILDDVLVQCDTERKTAILRVLHMLSKDRQVILFTQEDDVLSWAEQNFVAGDDRVERLQFEQ